MNKVVKLLLVLLLMINLNANHNKKAKEDDYEVYVDEIIKTFTQEMNKKYGLYCYGSGGSMPHNVKEISVSFSICKKPTLEEVRFIEVKAIERLLELINNHEKIRPYLAEYPFTSNSVEVFISFHNDHGHHHTDGNITRVSLIKNKLFFRLAKKVIKEESPIYDFNGKRINLDKKTYEDTDLITILKEPYEEALEKVKNNSTEIFKNSN